VIDALWRELKSTGGPELLAVLLGVAYILLIMRRNRIGWLAGAVSSGIYVYLSARAQLPMQALLQVYYVLMAAYGWHEWTRTQQQPAGGIGRWPWRAHVAALGTIAVLSLLTARWLQLETHAAWPYLDSATTWTSLLATWLVARLKLENWLYWMAADAVTLFLFAAQGHPFSALLFGFYLLIASFGYREWRHQYQRQSQSA
jgi:nicotinamide mononucleotide transporter